LEILFRGGEHQSIILRELFFRRVGVLHASLRNLRAGGELAAKDLQAILFGFIEVRALPTKLLEGFQFKAWVQQCRHPRSSNIIRFEMIFLELFPSKLARRLEGFIFLRMSSVKPRNICKHLLCEGPVVRQLHRKCWAGVSGDQRGSRTSCKIPSHNQSKSSRMGLPLYSGPFRSDKGDQQHWLRGPGLTGCAVRKLNILI
jgi:hypothetical protein